MKKAILIIEAIITLILAFLWWNNTISEPLFTIVLAVVTLITYILFPNTDSTKNITQKHSGTGDNVVGNKTTNYYDRR